MTFIRYIGIQLVAYAVDMGVFVVLVTTGFFGPIIANVMGKVAAGSFAFIAHRNFTFGANEATAAQNQLVRYFILLALNIPLSSLVLAALLLIVDRPAAAKILADIACVALTYWLSKSFVFVREQQVAVDQPGSENRSV